MNSVSDQEIAQDQDDLETYMDAQTLLDKRHREMHEDWRLFALDEDHSKELGDSVRALSVGKRNMVQSFIHLVPRPLPEPKRAAVRKAILRRKQSA